MYVGLHACHQQPHTGASFFFSLSFELDTFEVPVKLNHSSETVLLGL